MKEIFGPKSVLNNNYWIPPDMYQQFLKKMWEKIPFEKKGGAESTIVNVFVDKLENINKEEMKRKAYQFARFLQDDINLKTYLQVYIRDNSFFENYNLVAYQVYPPFRNREDIKIILNKIKNKEKISEKEKITLVNVFYKSFNYNMRYTYLFIWFKDENLKNYQNQEFEGILLRENYIDEGLDKNEKIRRY